jgi:hypothetical protein
VFNKLKQIGWIKTAGLILTAILLALAGAKAVKKKSVAKKKEDRAAELMGSGISKEIQKGKKLLESANKDKDAGVAAKQRMEKRLEKLGESNEDIDALAHRFNSDRVRKRSGTS